MNTVQPNESPLNQVANPAGVITDFGEVERWFVRRGVPQVIDEYKATTDVFTRMVPYFVLIFLLGALSTFGDKFKGWTQAAVLLAAIAMLASAAAAVNRVRGRRPFAWPDTIGVLEVGLFLVGSPVLALVFLDDRTRTSLQLLALNVALLGVGYVVTAYGLFPMVRWGVRQMWREIRGIITLLARTLPLLLLFATFIFINAEMWQVAHDLTWPLAVMVIAMIVISASGFLLLKLPTELAGLQVFTSWRQIEAKTNGCAAPITTPPGLSDPPEVPELGRRERLNFALLIFIAEFVQMALVAIVIGAFYVVFGLLTVRRETLLQWTAITEETLDASLLFDRPFTIFGAEVLLTWELLMVSSFIAAISALQFATSQLTDSNYRAEFSADVEAELREVLAVRATYLHSIREALAV